MKLLLGLSRKEKTMEHLHSVDIMKHPEIIALVERVKALEKEIAALQAAVRQ